MKHPPYRPFEAYLICTFVDLKTFKDSVPVAVTPAGSLHPLKLAIPEIRPEEIPDVPVNRFLFRGAPPPAIGDSTIAANNSASDALADAGNLQETFGDGAASRWKSKTGNTSKSGRKMKGRGAFRFRSPSPGGGGGSAAMDRERRERNTRVDRTWGRARKELEMTSKRNEEERLEEKWERKEDKGEDRRRDRFIDTLFNRGQPSFRLQRGRTEVIVWSLGNSFRLFHHYSSIHSVVRPWP